VPVRFTLLASIVLSTAIGASQQAVDQTEAKRAFDVASVKANVSDRSGVFRATRNRFVAVNVPLKRLIMNGFGVPAFRIVGSPGWVDHERFDIDAIAPAGVVLQLTILDDGNVQLLPPLLESLLRDRFGLRAHYETREMLVFELVRANKNRLGPGLRQVDTNCTPPTPDVASPCRIGPAPNRFVATGMVWGSGGMLLGTLSNAVSRPVVDKTGLSGQFDVKLEWSGLTTSRPNQVDQLTDSTSVFVAVQEQLGLKLVAARAPVKVLVIDGIDRPSEN
jgi:uncharacterized protein (TIGR03435 family)